MTWNNLYILPILALIACKVLPVLPDKRRSRRFRNSRRRTRSYSTLFSRWLVFSLLAGTLLTLLIPSKEYSSIVQGLFLTVMCMVPVMLYIAISHLIHTTVIKFRDADADDDHYSRPTSPASNVDSSLQGVTGNSGLNTGLSRSQIAEFAEVGSGKIRSEEEFLSLPDSSRGNNTHFHNSANSNLHAANRFDDVASILDDDLEMMDSNDTVIDDAVMRGQLERVSNNIGTYDLGTQQSSNKRLYREHAELVDNRESATVGDASSYNDIFDSVDQRMPQKSEKALLLKRKFIALQQDKKKLQRLVIAQQAAFDSEQLAHERSRTMAKEAIKIMRDARESQRIAVKVARLERSKRKTIEKEYVKVNKALVNALSTIQGGENANNGNRGRMATTGFPGN